YQSQRCVLTMNTGLSSSTHHCTTKCRLTPSSPCDRVHHNTGDTTMDIGIEKIVRRIEALLNTNGCTEAEAQSRIAKAQELLETYNLDMATVGSKPDGKRNDTVRKGGLYSWQRRLWDSVAKLNFCHYLSLRGLARGSQYEHRLIGSH